MNKKTLGRPRKYDPDKALSAALQEFRKRGYAATSLDNLVDATGMNRPSLYAAFGTKKEIFLNSIDHFRSTTLGAHRRILFGSGSLQECLFAYFDAFITSYNVEGVGLGCPIVCNITGGAVSDPDFQAELNNSLSGMDQTFVDRLKLAQETDELPTAMVPNMVGPMLAALQHSIAIRSRSGATSKELNEYAQNSIKILLT